MNRVLGRKAINVKLKCKGQPNKLIIYRKPFVVEILQLGLQDLPFPLSAHCVSCGVGVEDQG